VIFNVAMETGFRTMTLMTLISGEEAARRVVAELNETPCENEWKAVLDELRALKADREAHDEVDGRLRVALGIEHGALITATEKAAEDQAVLKKLMDEYDLGAAVRKARKEVRQAAKS